jgi:hypothetical protein
LCGAVGNCNQMKTVSNGRGSRENAKPEGK